MEERKPMQSPDIGKLAEALAAFQSEMPEIKLDAKVKVTMKSGRSYQFEYATLHNIMKKTLPILTKQGLSITQVFNGSGLKTILMHKSGQSISSEIPIDVSNGSMQEIGSRISYMRRYQLSPLLGIVADADDDANIADGNTYQKQGKKPAPKTPEKDDKPKDLDKWMTGWLVEAKRLRKELGDKTYYEILSGADCKHANEIKSRGVATTMFNAMTVALDKPKEEAATLPGSAVDDGRATFPPED